MILPTSKNTYLHYAGLAFSASSMAGGGVVVVLGGLEVFGHLWGIGSISSLAGGGATFLVSLASTAGIIVVMYHNQKEHKHQMVYYASKIETSAFEMRFSEETIDVKAKDKTGQTPLHYCQDAGLAEKLIEKRADVNAKDNKGCTPLHYAVNNLPLLKMLISKRANVNAVDNRGQTPLHKAKLPEAIDALIERRARTEAEDNQGKTPLFYAESRDTVAALIKGGADVLAMDEHSQSPIHYIMLNDHFEAFEKLLEKSAVQTIRDKKDNTLLHYAVKLPDVKYLKALIELEPLKGLVNAVNRKGNTPLHVANIHSSSKAHCSILQKNGARTDLLNKEGKTPFKVDYKPKKV